MRPEDRQYTKRNNRNQNKRQKRFWGIESKFKIDIIKGQAMI